MQIRSLPGSRCPPLPARENFRDEPYLFSRASQRIVGHDDERFFVPLFSESRDSHFRPSGTFPDETVCLLKRDCICIGTQFILRFLGGNPGRGLRRIAFLSRNICIVYTCCTRGCAFAFRPGAVHARTGAVKLRRNHREFLRREKGGWLSGEDPSFFSAWRRGRTAVIGGTFLSECSFPSRRSSRGPVVPPSRTLDRISRDYTVPARIALIRRLYVITRCWNP